VTIRVYEANMNAFARPARYSYVEAIKLPASGDRVLDVPLHLANNVSNSVLYAEALTRRNAGGTRRADTQAADRRKGDRSRVRER